MLTKTFLIFPALVLASSLVAQAQNLRNTTEPAELPPASFGGAQYVDSAGCVFLRAGVNGNTVWVPRVTRTRVLVCGRSPTFTAVQATASAPAAPIVRAVATAQPAPTTRRTAAVAPVATRNVAPVAVTRSQGGIRVPSGFRSAWSDDRLNRNRGPRTAQGDAQMALVWTDTVPRRLVVQK